MKKKVPIRCPRNDICSDRNATTKTIASERNKQTEKKKFYEVSNFKIKN